MGADSDFAALGEVGREGVAVASLEDMQILFSGIPLGEVSTSMTINPPPRSRSRCTWSWGRSRGRQRRTARDDPDGHPQGVHRAERVHLPARAVDAARDRHGRVLRGRCRSGTRSRSPGTTSGRRARRRAGARLHAQGRLHVRRVGARARPRRRRAFAPRLSFFFNAHLDFFEEIAKYRAARRIGAREMRNTVRRPGRAVAADALHTQTAGVSLTWQQPLVNVKRTAIEALARGARRDAVPAHELLRRGARAADRGRRTIGAAHAAGDRARDRGRERDRPARRPYHVEALTNRLEEEAYELFRRIDELGGMVAAIEQNMPQREIAEAAYRYQQEVESGEGRRRRQPLPHGGGRGDPHPAHRPRPRAQADRAPARTRRGATRRLWSGDR